MGKAARWLKGLLGMKKEKKRCSFGESSGGRGEEDGEPDMVWLRSYLADSSEEEQNKHAIAVAAAADAAVAAAQAAVAVMRLSRNSNTAIFGGGGKERWAAVKIQTVFKGFLARKALRALKGLVKLQAIVRGFLVRKRAAATLHSIQALIRAQTAARSQRARRSFNKENSRILPKLPRPRRTIERFDESLISCFDESPKIVEIDTFKPRSRSRRYNAELSERGEDMSSQFPCPVQARISIPYCQNLQDLEWHRFTTDGDECRFSTAHSTPRFANSLRSDAPPTPSKSVCGRSGHSYFRPPNYSNQPNYMASTQSFKAKLRYHSVPKQRPEPGSGAKSK